MKALSRRLLLAASPAAAMPTKAAHPDVDLLTLCAEHIALDARYKAIIASHGRKDPTKGSAADQELDVISGRMADIVEAAVETGCRTIDEAKALAMCFAALPCTMWDDPGGSLHERFPPMIIRALVGRA